MNRKEFIIFLVSILIFTTFTGVWANTEDELTQELKENLIPLKTTLAESGLEDLMPLKEIYSIYLREEVKTFEKSILS